MEVAIVWEQIVNGDMQHREAVARFEGEGCQDKAKQWIINQTGRTATNIWIRKTGLAKPHGDRGVLWIWMLGKSSPSKYSVFWYRR